MSRYFPIVSKANNISNSVIWYQIVSIQLSSSTIIIPTLEEITGTILALVFVNTSNYLLEVFAPEPCFEVISNLLLVFIESKILKYLTVLVLLSALICKKDPRTIQFFFQNVSKNFSNIKSIISNSIYSLNRLKCEILFLKSLYQPYFLKNQGMKNFTLAAL